MKLATAERFAGSMIDLGLIEAEAVDQARRTAKQEERNLFDDPAYKEVVQRLRERLRELRIESGDPDLKFE